jgi:phosphatidylserine synthase
VSFVVAPAVLIFTLNYPHFFLWRLLVCLITIFCGVFRLARFNTEAEEKTALFFNGLPTPGFAMCCASIALVHYRYNLRIEPRVISVTVAILAMFMVSGIKYPTFKNVSLLQLRYLLGFALILPVLFFIPEITVFILSFTYVILMPCIKNKVESRK